MVLTNVSHCTCGIRDWVGMSGHPEQREDPPRAGAVYLNETLFALFDSQVQYMMSPYTGPEQQPEANPYKATPCRNKQAPPTLVAQPLDHPLSRYRISLYSIALDLSDIAGYRATPYKNSPHRRQTGGRGTGNSQIRLPCGGHCALGVYGSCSMANHN